MSNAIKLRDQVRELYDKLTQLASALRKLDDAYRSLQNDYMEFALKFSTVTALVELQKRGTGTEDGDE